MCFSDEVESIFTRKDLEKTPTAPVEQFVPPVQVDLNVLSPEVEQILQKTMHRLAERVGWSYPCREGGLDIASYPGFPRLFHTTSDKSLGRPGYEARLALSNQHQQTKLTTWKYEFCHMLITTELSPSLNIPYWEGGSALWVDSYMYQNTFPTHPGASLAIIKWMNRPSIVQFRFGMTMWSVVIQCELHTSVFAV